MHSLQCLHYSSKAIVAQTFLRRTNARQKQGNIQMKMFTASPGCNVVWCAFCTVFCIVELCSVIKWWLKYSDTKCINCNCIFVQLLYFNQFPVFLSLFFITECLLQSEFETVFVTFHVFTRKSIFNQDICTW